MEHQAAVMEYQETVEIQKVRWNANRLLRKTKKLFMKYREALMEHQGAVMEYHEVLM